ncbi:hypothetical protein BC829DRAFT_25101 [Chytridium lagenaria]|nr:hypothetical protein BC829DRAFT_25101 [Chytridium lagenaria]
MEPTRHRPHPPQHPHHRSSRCSSLSHAHMSRELRSIPGSSGGQAGKDVEGRGVFGGESGVAATVVDVEVVVVGRGSGRGVKSVPVSERTDSINRGMPTKQDLAMGIEDGVVPYTALYSFKPAMNDEVELSAGHHVKISDSFADGWGVGQNLVTGQVGFMPMHYLNPDLVVGSQPSSHGAPPQPSPPVSPTMQPKKGEFKTEPPAAAIPPSYNDSISGSMASLNLSSTPSRDVKHPPHQPISPPSTSRLPPTILSPIIDTVVNAETAEAHIGLLHRFILLQSRDQMTDWKFLCRAEQRYLMWLDYLREERPEPASIPLPPIDVALIWHTHMLSPLRYYEDHYHLFSSTTSPHTFPLARMHALPGIHYDPQDGSKEVWEAFTGEPFTLPVEGPERPFNFRCAWCHGVSQVSGEAYVMYRMKDAGILCPGCQGVSTADNVSAKRFLDDLRGFRERGAPLRGSVLDEQTSLVNLSKAAQDLQQLFSTPTCSSTAPTNPTPTKPARGPVSILTCKCISRTLNNAALSRLSGKPPFRGL